MASFKGPPAAALICSACSFGDAARSISIVRTPGTNFFAKSNRLWKRSVMTMGSAPAALADSSETSPIGPAPLYIMKLRTYITEHARVVHTRRGQDLQGEDRHAQYLPRQQTGVRRARLPRKTLHLADGEATELDAGAILSMSL
jgi:hypothetical protein